MQADAFGGYDGIYAGEAGGRVTEVACWAHARRKVYDAHGRQQIAGLNITSDGSVSLFNVVANGNRRVGAWQ